MKICIVGPGYMPIPPTGWGAVEIIVWDFKQTLEKFGHEVVIVNTPDRRQIIDICNSNNPDFIHVQYDEYWDICDHFNCDNVFISSYYAYLEQENRHGAYYSNIFRGFLSLKKTTIIPVSNGIANMYIKNGFDPSRVKVVPSGARDDLFKFNEECEFKDKSIYLAKIEDRKRQHLFHNIENLYFAGNIADGKYNKNNYLGEWNKQYLYDNLTRYANLVLLSDGEAHPLVCMEAMSAGLGIVISECATANLDLSLPFIDVIPENRINDMEYVSVVIKHNREKSIPIRNEIRKYMKDNFSWEKIVRDYYLPVISESLIKI